MTDSQVRSYTTYSFIIERYQYANYTTSPWDSQAVAANSTLTLQFPSSYTYDMLQLANLESLQWSSTSGTISSVAVLSVPVNSTSIVLSNILSSPAYINNGTIKIANIKNPTPAVKTESFIAILGTDVSTAGGGSSRLQLTAGALGNCSATF